MKKHITLETYQLSACSVEIKLFTGGVYFIFSYTFDYTTFWKNIIIIIIIDCYCSSLIIVLYLSSHHYRLIVSENRFAGGY